jgi:hypothetical protein
MIQVVYSSLDMCGVVIATSRERPRKLRLGVQTGANTTNQRRPSQQTPAGRLLSLALPAQHSHALWQTI